MISSRSLLALSFLLIASAICLGAWPQPAVAQTGCRDLVVNGGMETGSGWSLGQTPFPAAFDATARHGGAQSLRLGYAGGANVTSYSSARQAIAVPADAAQATLSFWYLSQTTGRAAGDYLEARLLAADGQSTLAPLWRNQVADGQWHQVNLDLLAWRGASAQLYLNAYNDGQGGAGTSYIDDVSLVTCSPGSWYSTPVPTAAAGGTQTATVPNAPPLTVTVRPFPWTATAFPSAVPTVVVPWPVTATYQPSWSATPVGWSPDCLDLMANGSFETQDAGWQRSDNRIPAQVVTGMAHSGSLSMRLGSLDADLYSYSSVRQRVRVPSGYSQVWLRFWTYTAAEATTGGDRQEAVILAPDDSVLEKLWGVLTDERAWVLHSYPLDGYAGQTINIYFNVINDGVNGRAVMYLDDVSLLACGAGAATAQSAQPTPYAYLPVSVQASAPTASPTATPGMLVAGAIVAPAAASPMAAAGPALAGTGAAGSAARVTPSPPPTGLGPATMTAVKTGSPGAASASARLNAWLPRTWPAGWSLLFLALVFVLIVLLVLLMRPGG